MPKKIARIELCRESLKRIIHNLIKVSPFVSGVGKCHYCGVVRSHDENCIFMMAELVTKNVRDNGNQND
jgi:hypothetical protein